MHMAMVMAAGIMALVAQRTPGAAGSQAVLRDCLVSPKQRAQCSAQEAGVLRTFLAEEGRLVDVAEVLGAIDDDQAQVQYKAAEAERLAAEEQADSDVNVRFAIAARNVAQSELEQAEAANRKIPGAVSQTEVRRRQFALQRAELQIEQSQLEHRVARYTARRRAAESEAARLAVERRQVRPPFRGVIVEVFKQAGEWVNPGDPLFRIMELDQMYVEGFARAAEYLPSELAGRPVRVTAQIRGDRTAEFHGHVVFVSPEVDPINGVFRVKAVVENQKIENRQIGDHWLLRPGLRASMTIDLNGPPQVGQGAPRKAAR